MFSTLIAEDNKAFRQSLSHMLTGHFPYMQVAEAEDALEVLGHALARRFDLIFMDIRMPYGNGFELTQAIKSAFGDTFICILTTFDLPEYRDAAMRSGADLFLVKGDSTEREITRMVECLFKDEMHAYLH
jgi:DNA-binding NarL/FixJ family response regulator